MSVRHFVAIAAGVLVFASGCTSILRTPPQSKPILPTLWQGDGKPATPEHVAALFADADFILLGENHGHRLNLTQNTARWQSVLSARPRAALALEFFERDQQSYLDDYLAGLIDEAVFKQLARKTNPQSYPAEHRSMIEIARAAGRPVIAANAPRVYVRRARTQGLDSLRALTAEQRRLFRIPDFIPSGRYRDDFGAVMGQTPESKSRVDSMFLSQSVWDWTMAQSLVSASSDSSPVVLVVGRFHIDHRGGLVQALEAIAPGKKVVTVTSVDAWATDSLPDDDMGRADLVSFVGPFTPADSPD